MVSIFKIQCCFSLSVSSEERAGKEREREEQHMISTWGCRNSEFISKTHWRDQTGEREGAQKERESTKRRKRNRGREGERDERKGSPKKDREGEREREWSQRADTTCGCGGNDLAMEGDKFSGKTNFPETVSPDSPEWRAKCSLRFLNQRFHPDRVSIQSEPASIFPLGGIFHSLILSCLLTACFLWGLDLELGALQGLCSSFAGVFWSLSVFICSVPVMFAGFSVSCLCPPSPTPSAPLFPLKCVCLYTLSLSRHLFSNPCLFTHVNFSGSLHESMQEGKKKVYEGPILWWSDTETAFISVHFFSFCILPFFFGVKTGKNCVWTALLLSLVALIPLLQSVSPS